MAFAGFDLRLTKKALAAIDKELRNQERKVRVGAAIALTKTAKRAEKAIYEEMARVFDRPTRYTMNSLYVKPARANSNTATDSLSASVKVKDAELKNQGVVPVNYLIHQIEGGKRQSKRFERALNRRKILPDNHVIVPGAAATLDQYGNISPAQIVQILSYFQAFAETGYRANSTEATRAKLKRGTKRKRGRSYFVASKTNPRTKHLYPGIYMKEYSAFGASTPRPVFMFVREATYRKRLDFYGISQKTFDDYIDIELDAAIEFVRQPKRSAA